MKLIVGGYASGKKAFVKEKWGYQENEFTNTLSGNEQVLYDLQELDCSNQKVMQNLLLEKDVVICNEMGCGIVPMEKEDREKRESVGRLCVELAKEAEEVYRVYAGIGMKIK